jgi:hypothetical protein
LDLGSMQVPAPRLSINGGRTGRIRDDALPADSAARSPPPCAGHHE